MGVGSWTPQRGQKGRGRALFKSRRGWPRRDQGLGTPEPTSARQMAAGGAGRPAALPAAEGGSGG